MRREGRSTAFGDAKVHATHLQTDSLRMAMRLTASAFATTAQGALTDFAIFWICGMMARTSSSFPLVKNIT